MRASVKGCLFIIAAPSGAGKTTLVRALLAQDAALQLSVSHTTRAPREGEENGRDYHFIGVETFRAMREAGEFLESAEVHGNYYGTSRGWIEQQMVAGRDIVLEIDWQGARQVREVFPDAVSVFILPPSIEVLEARLRGRATDSEEVITRRLSEARAEIDQVAEYDYLVVNDDFEQARLDLISVIRSQRLRGERQCLRHQAAIAAMQTPA